MLARSPGPRGPSCSEKQCGLHYLWTHPQGGGTRTRLCGCNQTPGVGADTSDPSPVHKQEPKSTQEQFICEATMKDKESPEQTCTCLAETFQQPLSILPTLTPTSHNLQFILCSGELVL